MTKHDPDINFEISRCGWLTKDPLYIAYHDEEWGKPEYDSLKLFEMLCLEGQQAGLSWVTILKKRNNYKKHFHRFNPNKICKFTEKNIKTLMSNPEIVRHRGKIEAIIHNAKCYVEMEKRDENFSNFIWSFVDHKPIVNNWNSIKEVPTQNSTSIALSKALKKKGFMFVGSTICYAFMQACGLIDDHINDCFCKKKPKMP